MERDLIPLIPPSIEIPDSWSPELALEIADFLGDIVQAIWATHGSAMAQYLERPVPGSKVVCPEDDIPF